MDDHKTFEEYWESRYKTIDELPTDMLGLLNLVCYEAKEAWSAARADTDKLADQHARMLAQQNARMLAALRVGLKMHYENLEVVGTNRYRSIVAAHEDLIKEIEGGRDDK